MIRKVPKEKKSSQVIEYKSVERKKVKHLVCDHCDKKFSNKRARLAHIKHYHDDDPNKEIFPCTYCEKVFTYKRALMNHIRHLHMPPPPSPHLLKKRWDRYVKISDSCTYLTEIHFKFSTLADKLQYGHDERRTPQNKDRWNLANALIR